jgi:hypothetical protein
MRNRYAVNNDSGSSFSESLKNNRATEMPSLSPNKFVIPEQELTRPEIPDYYKRSKLYPTLIAQLLNPDEVAPATSSSLDTI